MSDETKKRINELVGRFTVALCTIGVACVGWAARELYRDMRTHSAAIGQLQSAYHASEQEQTQLTENFERAWRRIEDHQRRITRREDNAFTARDANDLSTSVAMLALQNAELSKDLEKLSAQLISMQADLQNVREAMIRSGTLDHHD